MPSLIIRWVLNPKISNTFSLLLFNQPQQSELVDFLYTNNLALNVAKLPDVLIILDIFII